LEIKDPVENKKCTHYLLPLSIDCLYRDLLKATRLLIEELEKNKSKKREAQKVYKSFSKPVEVSAWWL